MNTFTINDDVKENALEIQAQIERSMIWMSKAILDDFVWATSNKKNKKSLKFSEQ